MIDCSNGLDMGCPSFRSFSLSTALPNRVGKDVNENRRAPPHGHDLDGTDGEVSSKGRNRWNCKRTGELHGLVQMAAAKTANEKNVLEERETEKERGRCGLRASIERRQDLTRT